MAYYYNQLTKIEQKAYYAMKEGLLNLAPSFTVPLLDGKTLSDIYFMVRMDHPEIFWSVKFSYKYYKDSDHAEMIPEYLFKKNQIAEHPEIETIYIVTDSEPGYREMIAAFEGKNTYQLYRDYLDNFRINTGR